MPCKPCMQRTPCIWRTPRMPRRLHNVYDTHHECHAYATYTMHAMNSTYRMDATYTTYAMKIQRTSCMPRIPRTLVIRRAPRRPRRCHVYHAYLDMPRKPSIQGRPRIPRIMHVYNVDRKPCISRKDMGRAQAAVPPQLACDRPVAAKRGAQQRTPCMPRRTMYATYAVYTTNTPL